MRTWVPSSGAWTPVTKENTRCLCCREQLHRRMIYVSSDQWGIPPPRAYVHTSSAAKSYCPCAGSRSSGVGPVLTSGCGSVPGFAVCLRFCGSSMFRRRAETAPPRPLVLAACSSWSWGQGWRLRHYCDTDAGGALVAASTPWISTGGREGPPQADLTKISEDRIILCVARVDRK